MGNVEKDWKHAGYRAIHFHVKQKVDLERDVEEQEDPDLWRKRVEVQVSTSVIHAWSEVEHDLIYKNPWQPAPNITMDRMVDAINDLAITSEILLQQLQGTFNKLREDGAESCQRREKLMEWIIEVWPDSAKFDLNIRTRQISSDIWNHFIGYFRVLQLSKISGQKKISSS
ncbi:hypothetical protein CC78DRAFT_222308 [Lojkania enalia]|uniref:RelA/SpoT domain-containing protein n=1 Tax=Lojkania enalia TaxID=147567 RepID=A0A9P4K932_9PLEO|nr:hypothetical protein CC78DRAFT_222308 [Didymosphaeria enalia]